MKTLAKTIKDRIRKAKRVIINKTYIPFEDIDIHDDAFCFLTTGQCGSQHEFVVFDNELNLAILDNKNKIYCVCSNVDVALEIELK